MNKQPLWRSYIAGIVDKQSGESYPTIIGYFVPELVTAFLLCSVLNVIDAGFLGHLKSTSMFATQGVTSVFIYFLTKVAEGFSIGTVVLCGHYNGLQQYHSVGRAAVTSLWITLLVGATIAGFLYSFPYFIYSFYQVPEKMVGLGVSFLRLRAVGIFFSFVYFGLIGFLRGIKRPVASMQFFLLGGVVFVFFDYVLIFGKWGFPELQLQGSAWASVLQYGAMLLAAVLYVFFDKKNSVYKIRFFRDFDLQAARDIIRLSWPVMMDKATLAVSKIWLVRLLAPMGTTVLAGYTVFKEMEQFAFVPAIAFSQVITFLVSNDYSIKNWLAIKNNIKKVLFLSSIMVFSILVFFSLNPAAIISLFDKKGTFTEFTAQVFPILSILVFFDLLQCILSGALRGASDVKAVMWTRLVVCSFVFGPLAYGASLLPLANPVYKFVLIFGSYYISNAVMAAVYVFRFRREAWKYQFTRKQREETHDQNNIQRDRTLSQNIAHQN